MKRQLSLFVFLATLALVHTQNQGFGQGQGQIQAAGQSQAGGQNGAKGFQASKGQGNQNQAQGNNAGNGAAAAAAAAAAADDVNAKANNGADGITAAAKVDAAVLLANAGDPGAQDSGPEFEAAVKKIVGQGNQDDIDTLKAAGVDVDAVVGGGKSGKNSQRTGSTG